MLDALLPITNEADKFQEQSTLACDAHLRLSASIIINDYLLPVNLNRNGIETHTDTGPFCMTAGVKIHCFAASSAAWTNISASLFRVTTLRTFPSLSTHTFTKTFPSRPARRARSGYFGSTRLTTVGSFSYGTKSGGGPSSWIFRSCSI